MAGIQGCTVSMSALAGWVSASVMDSSNEFGPREGGWGDERITARRLPVALVTVRSGEVENEGGETGPWDSPQARGATSAARQVRRESPMVLSITGPLDSEGATRCRILHVHVLRYWERMVKSESLSWLVTLRWLVRLRSVAVAGQVAILLICNAVLGLALPVTPTLALVTLTAASNAALAWRARKESPPSDRLLAAALLFDVLVLAGLLALTGGPSNPFSVLFLVYVTLGAMVLRPRWAWSIVAVSVVSYGALFLLPPPVGAMSHVGHGGSPMHLQGMWLAFAVAASLITSFVTRIAEELRTREREVEQLQHQAALTDKLASLSTLAAGAAHELGTPLSTIAVVAKELERALARTEPADSHQVEDARLIRAEVERCRGILQQLSSDAGQAQGERLEPVALSELSRLLGESLSAVERERVRLELGAEGTLARVPPRSLVQALRNLVRNGLDASVGQVTVALARVEGRVRVRVLDQGPGMPPEVLARAGEPFFTTKAPGRGMGLGLFLARAVAEKLGGTLQLTSSPQGTVATLELPMETA